MIHRTRRFIVIQLFYQKFSLNIQNAHDKNVLFYIFFSAMRHLIVYDEYFTFCTNQWIFTDNGARRTGSSSLGTIAAALGFLKHTHFIAGDEMIIANL